jgi:Fur family ferric uptake transcriptional regulator
MKRNTKQAKVITEVIRSAGRPLTPSEIHECASQNIARLGIATIYRHLKALSVPILS